MKTVEDDMLRDFEVEMWRVIKNKMNFYYSIVLGG